MFITTTPANGEQADLERNRRWAGLIRRLGGGDIDALAALYDESSTIVFGLVYRILQDRPLAEDTLIDVYNHTRRNAGKFDPRKQSVLDWLLAIARQLAVDRLRRRDIQEGLKTVGNASRYKRDFADSTVAQLSEGQRSILEMTYFGGLSAEEAAGVLGMSREDVAREIAFGVQKLRTSAKNASGRAAGTSSVGLKRLRTDFMFFL